MCMYIYIIIMCMYIYIIIMCIYIYIYTYIYDYNLQWLVSGLIPKSALLLFSDSEPRLVGWNLCPMGRFGDRCWCHHRETRSPGAHGEAARGRREVCSSTVEQTARREAEHLGRDGMGLLVIVVRGGGVSSVSWPGSQEATALAGSPGIRPTTWPSSISVRLRSPWAWDLHETVSDDTRSIQKSIKVQHPTSKNFMVKLTTRDRLNLPHLLHSHSSFPGARPKR